MCKKDDWTFNVVYKDLSVKGERPARADVSQQMPKEIH